MNPVVGQLRTDRTHRALAVFFVALGGLLIAYAFINMAISAGWHWGTGGYGALGLATARLGMNHVERSRLDQPPGARLG